MFPRKLLFGFLVTFSALVFLMATSSQAAPRPVVNDSFRIVIDPGHGGSNEGCLGHDGELHEKEITLRIAQELRAQLRADLPHAEVVLTREADVTMTLAQRVAFANEQQADLFLSIHANASPEKNQSGFESYVLDLEASNFESARTAQRENDEGFAVPQSADPVAAMVRELALTHHRTQAARFASLLQRMHGHSFPQRVDRGVRTAPFDVLMGARVPAVLHEVGFLDHAEEGQVIASQSGVQGLAAAMSQAVVEYYRARER